MRAAALLRDPPRRAAALLAAVLVAAAVATAAPGPPLVLAVTLAVAAAPALAAARPLLAAAAGAVGTVLLVVVDGVGAVALVAVTAVLATAVASASGRAAAAAGGLAVAVLAALLAGEAARDRLGDTDVQLVGPSAATATLYAAAFAAPLLGALAVRVRAARRRDRERVHAAEAAREATEERLALARDLHDVVAHHLSGIAVLAQSAGPRRADEALDLVARESRRALDEVRGLVGALRGDPLRGDPLRDVDGPGPADAAGLGALPALVDRACAAGATVVLRTDLGPADLAGVPATVSLAAHRIAQEALTNVLRHADPPTARVHVERRDGDLALVVDDDGRPRAPSPAGHGLTGMRERADRLGGRLTAGPRAGGGWTVTAVLPLGPDRS